MYHLETIQKQPGIWVYILINYQFIHLTDRANQNQTCRNRGILEYGIPSRCDICRQFWSYLQTNHVYLQTFFNMTNYEKNSLTGILQFSIPGFLHV